ncbi:sodium/potassium-transporting ATPase subunit beta-1-like [Ceratitis capitata]|uniref:(Mediterranean fruit fly) hypothetical protein n=2 Tax=Ceratitis capitata TaxID=7213 RepID=A0A811U9T2_CERCA|nr:sodium/potassium-transporting ATPase subunit beta-1-like [Ceratitis capitata]CAD6995639.1 unnamed protein product [Ceratitis capitata]
MFETSGKYVLVKRFRHEDVENSKALVETPPRIAKKIRRPTFQESPQTKRKNERRRSTPPESTKEKIAHLVKVVIFYILLYMGIALLFYTCYSVYKLTLPIDGPRVKRLQPSLVYYPDLESYYVNRISWNGHNEKDINLIVSKINSLLKKFGKRRDFEECKESDHYGYKTENPCIFLQVNLISGFYVDPIEDANDLHRRERALKKVIYGLPSNSRKGRLWISCKSNSWKQIDHIPNSRSIPVNRILTNGTKRNIESDYGRIVVIRIENITQNVPININCKMFAKNIEMGDANSPWIGGVAFDVLSISD